MRPRRIEPWPVGLALLLLAMIAGSLAFLAVAAAHPDPLVVEDAYVAGLQYNDAVRARRRAEALGVSLELTAEPRDGGMAVRVQARGPGGDPVRPQAVRVRRERPAEGGLDADFELRLQGGVWSGQIPLPRPGRWRLIASADVTGETLRVARAVWR
jgi:nitrogen fixation protein FixH